MGNALADLASGYAARHGKTVRSPSRLRAIYDGYVRRRESTLLEAAAAAAAVDAIFFSDEIDLDAVTPQMREAFARGYPGHELAERLDGLRSLDAESDEVRGFLSNWKGVYHEVLVRDRLNDGQQIGSIVLDESQTVVLPDATNQPGFDLRILNADGTEDAVLQAKATNEIGYLQDALERYPDIDIAATNEAAQGMADEQVFPSGFNNEDLDNQVFAPMEEVWDGPVEQFVERVLPGLPFVIIATSEGAKVLMGRQTFQTALRQGVQRSVRSGAAMGVGALMATAGAGMFSLPAVFATRLGIDRYQIHSQLAKKIERDRTQLASLVKPNARLW